MPGAQLEQADLSLVNLRGANLLGACLQGANLVGAQLRGADLYGADLRGADLTGADLIGATLCCADLRGANLTDALLESAWLEGANLSDSRLQGTSAVCALYTDATAWPGEVNPSLMGAINVSPDVYEAAEASLPAEVRAETGSYRFSPVRSGRSTMSPITDFGAEVAYSERG
jgi:hypothetical protein